MTSLRDLGLSEYEARAYRAPLRMGATTAEELSRASDVLVGCVYDVLNSPGQYHLSRSQAASRPKKYVVVEPDTAFDRLLESKRQELAKKVEQYKSVVAELIDELNVAEPVHNQFWTAAVGADETIDLFVERLATADDSLVMVAGTPSPQFDLDAVGDLVVDELEVALDCGVDVSMLMLPGPADSLPENTGQSYMDRPSSRSNFRVRTAENVTDVFNLIDDMEVCIEVPNPLNPGQAFTMIDPKDPEFAADLRVTFDPRWEEAVPLPL